MGQLVGMSLAEAISCIDPGVQKVGQSGSVQAIIIKITFSAWFGISKMPSLNIVFSLHFNAYTRFFV